jgi:subtilase family serine protease
VPRLHDLPTQGLELVLKNMLRALLVGAAFAPAAIFSPGLGGAEAAVTLPQLPQTGGLLHRVSLPGTVAAYTRTARALGAAAPNSPARALIALSHRHQANLERFIADVSNPRSRTYEHYLTPRQFNARYAASAASVSAVEAFARGYGLHVTSVPSNRAYVYVTGSVLAMGRAFHTTIERYLLDGRTVQAPSVAASVPARLRGLVTGIEGLDTADVAHPMGAAETPPAPAYVNAPPMASYWGEAMATQAPGAYGQSVLPNVVQGYAPQQVEGAYGVSKAIRAGLDGSGQTVAVIDAYSSPTIAADANTWSKLHHLPLPKLTVIDNAAERDQPEGPTVPTDVPGAGGLNLQDPQGWFGEETLDVEAVHAMAPGANIVMQAALSPENVDLHMAQNAVVSKGEAQIVSNSYGGTTDDTDTTSDGYWQQAAAQGIGVYFSSGDDGDQTAGGTDPSSRTVDAGANSPYVTAVGGTTLAVGPHHNRLFETYWGTDSATLANGAWGPSTWNSGGGGGTSEVYGEPVYQRSVVPTRFSDYWKGNANATSDALIPGRVVPDIAMVGDPNSGFLMGQTEDFTAFSNPLGYDLPGDTIAFSQYRIGGTSLSSPLFAGEMAIADQAAGVHHGFANPALYAAYHRQAFHNIAAPASKVAVVRTNYVNNTNADGGTQTILRTAGDTGTLSAVPGYDDSTGLGSPNGLRFLAALAPNSTQLNALVAK